MLTGWFSSGQYADHRSNSEKLKMSMDHVILTLENQGNTSSASVLLALNEGIRDGRIQRGQVVLLEAFGAGFTLGLCIN
jgi:3-oxoacyl-[acyl-carrier-protein] synthase-3